VTDFALIIAFRDRGVDPCRPANLDSALRWWHDSGIYPIVVDDGRTGDAQWNRSAAYNRGARMTDAEVLVYSEADMLLDPAQILQGVELAAAKPRLVVPFSRFMAMSEHDSERVRRREIHPSEAEAQMVRRECTSIGAVNIVSREALELVGGGYDEAFEGHAYDDDAMEWAFRIATGNETKFVPGDAWHQWHVPGAFFATPASTAEDLAATERNKHRWQTKYRGARSPEQIRALIRGER
jgi:hypothetical protein